MTLRRLASDDVARFYDACDATYRHRSTRHVHHGLWRYGGETRPEAKRALVDWVVEALALRAGERCVDIGSGYGESARYVAAKVGVFVSAVTNSALQHAEAIQRADVPVDCHLGDWCENSLASQTYDAAWSIECLEHVVDLHRALSECYRVLKPGGRLLVLSWGAGESSFWGQRLLLTAISRDNHLADLRTEAELVAAFRSCDFVDVSSTDLSKWVKRTWTPSSFHWWSTRGRSGDDSGPRLTRATLRMRVGYAVGAVRYIAVKGVRN